MSLQINTIHTQNEKLKYIYDNLMKERKNINNIVNNNTLNAAYEDEVMYVTSKYYNYIALTFTTILVILLFLKLVVSTPQTGGGNTDSNDKIGYFLLILFGILGLRIFIFNK
jgi:hypothetical protein